jgi:hypothetical protein
MQLRSSTPLLIMVDNFKWVKKGILLKNLQERYFVTKNYEERYFVKLPLNLDFCVELSILYVIIKVI